MTGPSALTITLAALTLTIAVYCAARLVAAPALRRRGERDADLAHTAMGVAMAGMLVPRLNPLPTIAWEALFTVAAGWFAWGICRRAQRPAGAAADHHAPHLVHAAAMLYMLAAARTPATAAHGMPGPSGSVAGLAFAVVMLGYAVLDADLLTAASVPAHVLAPRLSRLCRIGLGLTMSYAIIVMM